MRSVSRRAGLLPARRPDDAPVGAWSWTSPPLTPWSTWAVDDGVREAVEAARRGDRSAVVELASFDRDGRARLRFGALPGITGVTDASYLPRARNDVSVVLVDDAVLVRKTYRQGSARVLEEWRTLHALEGVVNVPQIRRIDIASHEIYKDYVDGRLVRDILVDAGATILLADTDADVELQALALPERLAAITARGAAAVRGALTDRQVDALAEQVEAMHRAGVTGISTTYGNVCFRGEEPWLIDGEGRVHRGAGQHFRYRRDQDRVKLNARYGTDLLTEGEAFDAVVARRHAARSWYAPIDFGGGLVVRGFWSTDTGTGRWAFLNGRVVDPLVAGKRVLDLGSNNGLNPLLMLRAGATSVVGLERDESYFEEAALVKRIFEHRDQRRYDLRMELADMRDVLDRDFGPVDVVTAFCSLYYLDDDEMRAVVRRARELAPVLILQANEATREEAAEEKSRKSSVQHLEAIAREAGFGRVRVIAPAGYSRPLLVAEA